MTKTLTFNVKGKEYQYEVTYPNVGQYIDIENTKNRLSNGKYSDMASSGLSSMLTSLDYIDCYAYFSTLIPQFVKDLNVNSFFELDLDDANEIVKVYKEQFLPWYLETEKQATQESENEQTDE